MKAIQVKEIMIPIANYITVKKGDSLLNVFQALENARKSESERAHRDAIVVDDSGSFIGKVTMIDIFRALEPNYKKMTKRFGGTLTDKFVMDAVRQFNLWLEPEEDICKRAGDKQVADVMHVTEKTEILQESDTLEKALNLYVMGVHQPLIVKNGDAVTGVVRFGDLFEVVRKLLLECAY
jgi:CBS domain containing-hemolysin-like protein